MAAAERWLPIAGHEGRYEVSDLGRVRSLMHRAPLILKPCPTGHAGYFTIRLRLGDGTSRNRRVSQLVLEAFVGPAPRGHGACHVNDPDKGNNSLSNLAWKTQLGNMEDRDRHGTTARGERSGRAKLTVEDVLAIRSSGLSADQEAASRGVSKNTIWSIRSKETWTNV